MGSSPASTELREEIRHMVAGNFLYHSIVCNFPYNCKCICPFYGNLSLVLLSKSFALLEMAILLEYTVE